MTVSTDKPARIFLDTEFMDESLTLISIGLVRVDETDNGPCTHCYYAELDGVDYSLANDWVKINVIPRLVGRAAITTREQLKKDILEFCGPKPEFWGYYADYDWVLFCKIFGNMVDLPPEWPMYCNDLKQLAVSLGSPKLPECVGEHSALHDAQWNRKVYDLLMEMA